MKNSIQAIYQTLNSTASRQMVADEIQRLSTLLGVNSKEGAPSQRAQIVRLHLIMEKRASVARKNGRNSMFQEMRATSEIRRDIEQLLCWSAMLDAAGPCPRKQIKATVTTWRGCTKGAKGKQL